MPILIQFLLRATFGLALAMAITSPRKVTSGFFRNHLYVILGMCVLAGLAALSLAPEQRTFLPLVTAALSYAGAIAWLYEKPVLGKLLLLSVAVAALIGDWRVGPQLSIASAHSLAATMRQSSVAADVPAREALHLADGPTAGLLLGSVLGTMFLGHWYLNSPTMELGPLRTLLILLAVATVLRSGVCAAGLACEISRVGAPPWTFLVLRWLAGLIGVGVMAWMAWQTLKIPNTQSATGILYVAVIGAFIGELTSQLLSAHAMFPL
jgi:hypothetical protein